MGSTKTTRREKAGGRDGRSRTGDGNRLQANTMPLVIAVAAVVIGTFTARQFDPQPRQVEPAALTTEMPRKLYKAFFSLCGSAKRINCVVDGDTFWLAGEKIRIADIDTPELSPPRCKREEELGLRAKKQLQALLNGGSFELVAGGRDQDRYGRQLRTVMRDGQSIGDMLVARGLARHWDGGRHGWCD